MTERKANSLGKRLILSVALAAVLIGLGLTYAGKNTTKNTGETPTAGFAPDSIQSWKDYIKNYPATLAQYQKEQERFRREAQPVQASGEKNIDDLIQTYPFLKEDLQETKNIQQGMSDSISKNPDPNLKQSEDPKAHIQIAESIDSKTGINLFFLGKSGRFWCGAHGCPMDVYLDTGAGYKKAGSFIITGGIYLVRNEKDVFLFAGPPQDTSVVVWALKGERFIESEPPPSEPVSQAFLEWRTQLEKAGKWPPQ